MPVIRSTTLLGFADLVTSLGGDPYGLAAAAGLPREALADREMMIPLEARAVAMELAATQLGCPDFGLRMAERADISGLGPLAIAIRHSATLRDAFECARRFLSLHNQGSTLVMAPDPYEMSSVVGIQHVWHYSGTRFPQATDAAVVGMHKVISVLAGASYTLRSVELGYRPTAPPAAYEAAFGGARINVGRETTMLRVPRSLLDLPIEDADGTLRNVALFWLDQQEAPDDLAVTMRARSVVESLLGTGRLTAQAVADGLEMPLRSLQRALALEQTSVAVLVEETRRERALQLLGQVGLPLSDVAAMLDFADQTTLVRAARRWWAVTPRAKRAAILAAGTT